MTSQYSLTLQHLVTKSNNGEQLPGKRMGKSCKKRNCYETLRIAKAKVLLVEKGWQEIVGG